MLNFQPSTPCALSSKSGIACKTNKKESAKMNQISAQNFGEFLAFCEAQNLNSESVDSAKLFLESLQPVETASPRESATKTLIAYAVIDGERVEHDRAVCPVRRGRGGSDALRLAAARMAWQASQDGIGELTFQVVWTVVQHKVADFDPNA